MDHPFSYVYSTLPEYFINEWLWYECLEHDEYGAYNVDEITQVRDSLLLLGFTRYDFLSRSIYEGAVARIGGGGPPKKT